MIDTYLERRLNLLLTKFEEGKILFHSSFFEEKDKKRLIDELELVKKLPDGRIDINSATSLVRSFARTFYNLEKFVIEKPQNNIKDDITITMSDVIKAQREYFNLLEEFFIAATGEQSENFLKNDEDFSDGIHNRNAVSLSKLMEKAYPIYIPKIQEFHTKNFNVLTKSKDVIGGVKCVYGGSSRINQSTFDSYRKIALYSDTVFIPDPILPWLEVERKEERFNLVYLLQSCYYLLKYKPLVDAELPYPAIIVFPSWEKSLEQRDEVTQDGISSLIIRFFSHYLERNFEDEREIFSYVVGKGKEKFRSTVINKKLFIPPNSSFPKTFNDAYDKYIEFVKEERSNEFVKMILSSPSETVVLNGIIERIGPQYHVLDNSRMLNALPLFYLSVFYHYYILCADIIQSDFNELGMIDKNTLNILNSLNHPSNAWLGNIPFNDLVDFRKDNLNEEFRKKLNENINDLRNVSLDNINIAVSEIGRSLASIITEHNKVAKKISDEYLKKHFVTAGLSILTLGVSLYPFLTPLVGTLTALSPLGKYMYDNLNYYYDRKPLKKSMLGILADAHKSAV